MYYVVTSELTDPKNINNQKIIVVGNFFSCFQTLDLTIFMLFHTSPFTQTAF